MFPKKSTELCVSGVSLDEERKQLESHALYPVLITARKVAF